MHYAGERSAAASGGKAAGSGGGGTQGRSRAADPLSIVKDNRFINTTALDRAAGGRNQHAPHFLAARASCRPPLIHQVAYLAISYGLPSRSPCRLLWKRRWGVSSRVACQQANPRWDRAGSCRMVPWRAGCPSEDLRAPCCATAVRGREEWRNPRLDHARLGIICIFAGGNRATFGPVFRVSSACCLPGLHGPPLARRPRFLLAFKDWCELVHLGRLPAPLAGFHTQFNLLTPATACAATSPGLLSILA